MAANEKRHQKKLTKKRPKDKERRRKAAAQPATQQRIVLAHELNVNDEANYIIRRAQEHESRVVSLGDLVLFSTESGDAWLLDKDDEMALCVCRDGVKQRYTIIDSPTKFSIQWQGNFKIEGEAFTLIDESSNIRTIIGYPTEVIQSALTNREEPDMPITHVNRKGRVFYLHRGRTKTGKDKYFVSSQMGNSPGGFRMGSRFTRIPTRKFFCTRKSSH